MRWRYQFCPRTFEQAQEPFVQQCIEKRKHASEKSVNRRTWHYMQLQRHRRNWNPAVVRSLDQMRMIIRIREE